MRPHFKVKLKWILHPLAKIPFHLLNACTPQTPSAVVAKFCRRRSERECRAGAQARLVSSAKMLDGTIDTLTLVEGRGCGKERNPESSCQGRLLHKHQRPTT